MIIAFVARVTVTAQKRQETSTLHDNIVLKLTGRRSRTVYVQFLIDT